jgi:predicted outer membrane repeat protein
MPLLFVGLSYSTAVAGIIYVDCDATGANNGSSWTDAYKYLQDALGACTAGCEIWVAEGTYKADCNTAHPDGTKDRDATFRLKNGCAIYGGFAGGETVREQRDWRIHKTILSGDLNGDDGLNFANNGENSYHVVKSTLNDPSAILDGFTVTSGNANVSTSDRDSGGGLFCFYSSPTVANCIFSWNAATYGGGMLNDYGSSPTVSDCTFYKNAASSTGGGLANYSESNPMLVDCVFHGNSAGDGGGIYNSESSPALIGCLFTGNSASNGGGIRSDYGTVTLMGCVFKGNSVGGAGGGLYASESIHTLSDCDFNDNRSLNWYIGDSVGGGMYNYARDTSTTTNLTRCRFTNNLADGEGGGIYNDASPVVDKTVTVMLKNCTFSGNVSLSNGGGLRHYSYTGYYESGGVATMVLANCAFKGNSSAGVGGGIYNSSAGWRWDPARSTTMLMNCTFTGNSARDTGGGVYSTVDWGGRQMEVHNCDFSKNTAFQDGGAVTNGSGELVVDNSILWDNTSYFLWENTWDDMVGSELSLRSGTVYVSYCDVLGGQEGMYISPGATLIWDSSNINADPRFIDPDGPDNVAGTKDDNLRLSGGSPCIDAGDNNAVPPDTADLDGDGNTTELTPFDLDENPRFVDDPNTTDTGNGTPPIVDMGAYEYGTGVCGDSGHPYPVGDFNHDCFVDFRDFAQFADEWLVSTAP